MTLKSLIIMCSIIINCSAVKNELQAGFDEDVEQFDYTTEETARNRQTFHVDFLRSLNTVTVDIKKWVFQRYSDDIKVTTLKENDILQLSSPHDDDAPSIIELKKVLEKMLNALECFHSVLTFRLFIMIRHDYTQMNINPRERVRITIWEFYKYLTRMNAVFSYGNFVVQEWQSNIYLRFKEMQNIDCLEDFLANMKYHETQDYQLIITMMEFGNLCQDKSYLPQLDNVKNVLRKPYSILVYYDWLSCIMNIPCIRALESRDGDLEDAASRKFFADRRPEDIKDSILERLQLSRNEIRSLKHLNEVSASNFGDICRPSHNYPITILKKILFYDTMVTDAFRYEEKHKKDAIEAFKNESELEVTPCGVFVDEEFNFLSARPDGLIKDDSILIVKCPHNVIDKTPQDALEHNQFKFLKVEKTGNIVLRTNAKYYYEVQGQLRITQKQYCYFVVWTLYGLHYEKIYKDDSFWNDNMKEKLISFYDKHLLFALDVISNYNSKVIDE